MYRLCLLGCVALLAACGEKAPDEGAIRVSVTYGSFKPACVRVEARDAQGHQEATDIPATRFKNPQQPEVLVAVRRKADWDATMNVTVSSYAEAAGDRCSGEAVETFASASLTIVPKEYTRFDVTLKAVDGDGDGSPTGVEWAGVSDCDDTRADVRPGAEEKCDTAVDFDCDGKKACADSKCTEKTCTDGDLCTVGKKCVGVGEAAQCGGGEPKCKQTAGQCESAVRCEASTGACIDETVVEGAACDPGDKCVTNGRCTADKQCVGDVKACNTPVDAQCQEATGTCNSTSGQCEYAPKPVSTTCEDGDVCHDPGFCNGSGACNGTPTPCPPRECNVAAGCTRNASCIYAGDPAQNNTPCSEDNSGTPRVCKVDGQCVAFPYTPSNFDPNTISGGEISDLRTTGAVVFNTDDQTWTPSGSGPAPGDITFKILPQSGGAPELLLIPVRNLALGGELRIVGSRPVILAVYGDATLNHDILASGRIVNGAPVPGAGGNQACTTSQGKDGTYSGNEGGGGGGAGGATAGANGGRGYDTNATPGDAGAQQASTIAPLLGGCAGGNGVGKNSTPGGLGGAGGGAIQISVARTLTVEKGLSVSGGGGLGGVASTSPAQASGAGGGGSGGRIVLEAFQVNLTADAKVTANGGAGGEGAGQSSSTANNGANGASGSETTTTAAGGGTGDSPLGGTGGAGGALDMPTAGNAGGTVPVFGGGGGGGGGGGASGSIYLRSMRPCIVNTTVVSPTPTGGCTPL
ncbi:putative metal-binding motif-containing protein [Corallococcus sp. 4LFB]|uniref:putative metal-binding motif-containing protein n=1 Tax=Corallococcus sp. 4LFB TaxID=3383249 RepID=UPI0039759ED0